MSDATTVLLIDDDPRYRDYNAQRLHASSVIMMWSMRQLADLGLTSAHGSQLIVSCLKLIAGHVRFRGFINVSSTPLSS